MLIPAIYFRGGTCADAIKFYQQVFNATVLEIAYANEAPPDSEIGKESTEETRNHVMHSELIISGTRVNMADVGDNIVSGNMFLFNIFLDSADEIRSIFNQLSGGGQVRTELGEHFWSPLYGEVVDKFGVEWHLILN